MAKVETTQELVMRFCQQDHIREKLIYIEEIDAFSIYQSEQGYYKLYERRELEGFVYAFLVENVKKSLTNNQVDDFIKQMKYAIYLRIPSMNTKYIGIDSKHVLDTESITVEEMTPKTIAFNHIKLPKMGMDTEPTLFLKFLNEILVDKKGETVPELIDIMQEMFGYCMMRTVEAHACFFLVGKGRNGKSVLLNVLRSMVGEIFVSNLSIETLTKNEFAASGLVGKLVNICAEEESVYIKSDKFKAMVSGDPIYIRRLYQEGFSWVPTVVNVFATNGMPSFSGFNEGLMRRIRIIPFNRQIVKEKIDTHLSRKLLTELPQITLWALRGAKRLKENQFRFTQSTLIDEQSVHFQEGISSAVLFFNESYKVDENGFIDDEELYAQYVVWCDRKGKKKQNFYGFIADIETFTNTESVIQSSTKGHNFIRSV